MRTAVFGGSCDANLSKSGRLRSTLDWLCRLSSFGGHLQEQRQYWLLFRPVYHPICRGRARLKMRQISHDANVLAHILSFPRFIDSQLQKQNGSQHSDEDKRR
jgi:hypothetical protein